VITIQGPASSAWGALGADPLGFNRRDGLNPSLRAKRSNPSIRAKKEWVASSLSFLAMTADKVSPRGFNPPYGDGLTRPGDSDAGCFLAPARLHRNDRKSAKTAAG
jgi:hypothetical protein